MDCGLGKEHSTAADLQVLQMTALRVAAWAPVVCFPLHVIGLAARSDFLVLRLQVLSPSLRTCQLMTAGGIILVIKERPLPRQGRRLRVWLAVGCFEMHCSPVVRKSDLTEKPKDTMCISVVLLSVFVCSAPEILLKLGRGRHAPSLGPILLLLACLLCMMVMMMMIMIKATTDNDGDDGDDDAES
jgi:hypothetical protein